jgi:hypothetical protein
LQQSLARLVRCKLGWKTINCKSQEVTEVFRASSTMLFAENSKPAPQGGKKKADRMAMK